MDPLPKVLSGKPLKPRVSRRVSRVDSSKPTKIDTGMKTFTKKYQVWEKKSEDREGDYFAFTEYDTLQECITAEKHSDWYITKGVSLVVQEAGEVPVVLPANTFVPYAQAKLPKNGVATLNADEAAALLAAEEGGPEAAALAAAYGNGPVAIVG